jgi:predicted nucleic acid-binding protein
VTLYVDSSAFVKRYLDEPERESVVSNMRADDVWVSARHTLVEVHSTLELVPTPGERQRLRTAFNDDWADVRCVELDFATCSLAIEIATAEKIRTLDALHLAAAWRAGGSALRLLTFDNRQARAAQNLGIAVVSA